MDAIYCSQLFPCLTEIAEKSFVSSALESYQKVSETQEPEGLSAACVLP